MATRRQVSIFINGKQVALEIKAITAEKRKLVRELNHMTVGSKEYNDQLRKIEKLNPIINEHRKRLRGIESTYDKIKGGITRFAGIATAAFTAEAIVSYGRELFKLGTEMEVLGKKAKTVFGDALPLVTKEAEKNANAMGLTIGNYIDASAAIGDLLIPMKFQRDEAANMSTNLVNLSGALSEWTGGQISAEKVTKILGKAILGEREELKQLGISINEAEVKARIAEKGLSNLTGEFLQQAKAVATLELITEKSGDAQAAFAENADLNVRKQAELSAKIKEVSERLAIALLPVFSRLIDIANSAADVILDVSQAITSLTNPIDTATKAFDDQTQKVNNLEKDLVPLLDRYDELTSKSNLSEEEQKELAKVIAEIGRITPTAITEVDEYGQVLGISASASREFLEAEKARLEFINQEAIGTLEKQIGKLKERQTELKKIVETGKQGLFFGSEVALTGDLIQERIETLAEVTKQIKGAEAELARLSGSNLGSGSGQDSDTSEPKEQSPTNEEILLQRERAERLRKEREKQAEEEQKRKEKEAEKEAARLKKEAEDQLKALEKSLQQVQEKAQQFQQEFDKSQLSAREKALAEVREKFAEQIATAKELELSGNAEIAEEARIQRLELERLQSEELRQVREELDLEERAQREEFRKQLELELADELEAQLIQLEEHYLAQKQLAEQFGIDITGLTKRYEEERTRIQVEQQKKQKAQEEKADKERLARIKKTADATASALAGIGEAISGAIALAGQESTKFTALSKALAITQVAIKTAEAIANAVSAASSLPFPANLVAIAASVGTVLGNIAQARQLLKKADVPSVTQRKKGGYVRVLGQDDGILYNAHYIGHPNTGMLPDHPVLVDTTGGKVLGSEAGAEYFVSHRDLRNPKVLNHVRAIDNITRHRQFQEGGPTQALPPSTSPGESQTPATLPPELINVLIDLREVLTELQTNGVIARIDDDTIIDIRDRLEQLVSAGG